MLGFAALNAKLRVVSFYVGLRASAQATSVEASQSKQITVEGISLFGYLLAP